MATISLSKLKGLASQQLNDMDQAYSAIGYQRVGNSYVPDPNYISAAQAPSIANQTEQATGTSPITPQDSQKTQLPTGAPPAAGTVVAPAPLAPDTGTINNDIAGGKTVLDQISKLQDLVKTANTGGNAPSMGKGQEITGFLRGIFGNNHTLLPTSPGDTLLPTLANSLATAADQFFLNQKVSPATVDQVKNSIPSATDTPEQATQKLQTLAGLVQDQQKNIQAQYPQYIQGSGLPNTQGNQGSSSPTASPSPAAAAPAAKPGLSSIFGF